MSVAQAAVGLVTSPFAWPVCAMLIAAGILESLTMKGPDQ